VAKPGFMGLPADEFLVGWAQQELARFAPVLDAAVHGRDYLVGAQPTLADISVAHLEGFQPAVPFDWAPFPALNAYFRTHAAVRALGRHCAAQPACRGPHSGLNGRAAGFRRRAPRGRRRG
jgi:glutathione S-transferase